MAATLAERRAHLNRADKMSSKEALGLRIGGMFQYSHWHVQELVAAVGTADVAVIDNAFPGQEAEAAPRWMMRGLAAQFAYAAYRSKRQVQANWRQRE